MPQAGRLLGATTWRQRKQCRKVGDLLLRVAEKIEHYAATDRQMRVLSQRRRVEERHRQRARMVLLAAPSWQLARL